MNRDNNNLENILTKNWEYSNDRRMGYHLMHCFHHCFIEDFPKMFGVDQMSSVYTVEDGVTSFFYCKDEYGVLIDNMRHKLKNDGEFVKRLTKFIHDRYAMYEKYADSHHLAKVNLDNKSVWQALEKVKGIEEKMSAPFWVIFNTFEKLITETLSEAGVSEQDMKQLALSTKMIPLDLYKVDLYKAVIEDKSNSFEKVHKKYIHLGVFDFMFAQKDITYHKEQVAGLSQEDAKRRIDEIKSEYKNRKDEVKKLAQKYKQNIALIDLYKAFADVKEWKNFLREKVNNDLKHLMSYMAERCRCSLDEVALLTYNEIKSILILSEEMPIDIKARYKKSLFIFDKTNFYVLSDEVAYHSFMAQQHMPREVEIKGMVAFKGIVQGAVKIVVGERDFGKIKDGDILVASTTRPDFVPIMKKVRGFVTNEGGLLSHAAIVARELKKPCIIGTKIATKVLKDGDVVEVDAEKGIVRILKKA